MNTASDWASKVLPLRNQAEIQNRWLSHRLATVLPEVMQQAPGYFGQPLCSRH